MDTEPSADDARHRQKGPLFRCQDNATAAIVKSQGYCVVDSSVGFAEGPHTVDTHTRHTPAQTHTQRRQRNVTELDASTPLKMLLGGRKDGTEGGNKRGTFQKTLLNAQIKGSGGKKSVCAEKGGKKKKKS